MQKIFQGLGAAATFAMLVGIAGPASATVATCSSTYFGLGTTSAPWGVEANGTMTLPGTNIGTVATGCQIGNLATNNVSGTGVFVAPGATPSIFQFVWGGGTLTIAEALGNNGTLPGGVDVELGLASGNSLNGDGSLANSLASINFSSPFVFDSFKTLYNAPLAAGTYVIDTYSGTVTDDPTYQVDFTLGAAAVPEPTSLATLGAALLGLGWLRRRRRARGAGAAGPRV